MVAQHVLLLVLLLVGAVAFGQEEGWTVLTIEPTNPTPGDYATVTFQAASAELLRSVCEFRYASSEVAEQYATAEPNWECSDFACRRTDLNSCGENTCVINGQFRVRVNIPPDAVSPLLIQGWLTSYTVTRGDWWTQVLSRITATSDLMLGEPRFTLDAAIEPLTSDYVAGESAMMQIKVSNQGPSVARTAACDLAVSKEEFLVAPSNCVPVPDSNQWRCVASSAVSPNKEGLVSSFGIKPSPDYRGFVQVQVSNCSASGTLVAVVPDVYYDFNVSAVWDLTSSFYAETEETLEFLEVSHIRTLIQNNGPSSSLGSHCYWNFSSPALTFNGSDALASDCNVSYQPDMVVSCLVNAHPGDTIAQISITAKTGLAGTPSFNVSFSCYDEAGDAVESGVSSMLNVMVIEPLDGVDVGVEFVNWNPEEGEHSSESLESAYSDSKSFSTAVQKREQDDLGVTGEGQVIFDDAVVLLLDAASKGALYTRNVSCNVLLQGSDAPLVDFASLHPTCIDHGLQTQPNGVPLRLTQCGFSELRAEVSTKTRLILSLDARVKELEVSVDCSSPYTNTIQNPVYHQVHHFIHVYAEDSGRIDDASEDPVIGTWVWVIIGVGVGLLLAVVIPTVVCIVYRQRRASLRRQKLEMQDLENTNVEMELYATPKAFSSASPHQNSFEERGIQWEIPFAELKFEEEIGKGQFGVVWRGRWRETRVAIKMFNAIMSSPALRDNFKAEMDIMKHLRPHTNVVQLFGVCTDDVHPWCLVTEYLAQGDLRHYLRANPQPNTGAIIKMAVQAATGMHHLHSEGIIHRDLAARNVLLTADLEVKVGDFGLSRVANREVAESKVPVRWTAPEALLGEAEFNEKCDVWSYGVLLWEMMNAGGVPYSGKSNKQVLECVTDGQTLHLPPSAPPVLHEVLEACFQADPMERPSFLDVIKKLQQWSED
ncbi:Bone morphogenetic protein receptor type-1B [Balamuthia mandrillaris]